MKHTSGNQVNIQIKLCVHPNTISKGTKKHGSKGLLRVITWLGYKRKDICEAIEFNWPSIREHSFYLHSKDKFTSIPLILKKTFGVKTWYLDLDNLFYFWIFLSFSFSFSFLYHVHILFFSFSISIYNTMLSWSQKKNSTIYLTSDFHLPFLPNLNKNIPYLNVPLLYGRGTNKQWMFRVQSIKNISESYSASKMSWIWKTLGQIHQALCLWIDNS